MTFVISKFKNFKLLNIYKLGINVQSIFVITILFYGVINLLPGILSEKLYEKGTYKKCFRL